jgi:hypothetical protein
MIEDNMQTVPRFRSVQRRLAWKKAVGVDHESKALMGERSL